MNEKEHYLSVLVELSLYPVLRILTECQMTKEQVDKEQQKRIIEFINNLPEEYKTMQNRDEIIAKVLTRMGMKTPWAEKKLEEFSIPKKQKTRENKGKEER